MPSHNKIAIHNMPYFVTTRCQENIPFIPCLLINFLLWSILARAKESYDIMVCGFIFMGNHLHMLVVTNDPARLADFVGYIKRESAHAINDLLGRKKHTIWCEGYDSPILLTPEDVIAKLIYIILNPIAAGLVSSVNEYPGVSSWQMFKNGKTEKKMKGFSRYAVSALSSLCPSESEQKEYICNLISGSKYINTFTLEPWAWLKCFRATRSKKANNLKKLILDKVSDKEKRVKEEKQGFMGAELLKRLEINAPHQPQKFSSRSICICSDKDLRILFLTWYLEQQEIAKQARVVASLTGAHDGLPPGFFTSGGNLLSNLISMPIEFLT